MAGVTARCTTDLIGANNKIGGYYFHRFGEVIFLKLTQDAKIFFASEVEMNEFYFGRNRKRKHEKGVTEKVSVFGIFKRKSKIYTKIILGIL